MRFRRRRTHTLSTTAPAKSRLPATIFGAVFTLIGLGAAALLLYLGWDASRTARWAATPCTVVEARVDDAEGADGDYEFVVRYEYAVGPERYTGTTYRKAYGGTEDYADAWALVRRFGGERPKAALGAGEPQVERAADAGFAATCYVDPRDPTQAVLEPGGAHVAAFAVIPLVFATVGLAILWWTWRPPRPRREGEPRLGRRLTGRAAAVFLFGTFFLLGGGISLFFVDAIQSAANADDWAQTPCRVLSSRVRSHRDDDGTTYSVDIVYAYDVNGTEYRSNRYQFLGGSSSGRAGKQAVVDRHPPGARAVCYVNPDDPADAVLNAGLTGDMLFGLIPATFLLIGAGGLVVLAAKRFGPGGVNEAR